MSNMDERRATVESLSKMQVPTKSYEEYLAESDYDGIGHRDRILLAQYLQGDRHRTIASTARLLGYNADYFSTIASGYRPLTELAAKRINRHLDLGLWGVPRRRPKERRITLYREEYAIAE